MTALWFNGWGIPEAWFETCLADLFAQPVLRETFAYSSATSPAYSLAPQDDGVTRCAWVSDSTKTTQEQNRPRWWCGWSMGGLHAIAQAAEDPNCEGVVVVAGSPCFVRQAEWPFGVTEADSEDLHSRWRQSPAKTLNRFFRLITTGEVSGRAIAREFKSYRDEADVASDAPKLSDTLCWLLRQDYRQILSRIDKPIYFLLGEHDPLLPIAEAAALRSVNPRISVLKLPDTGHVPFVGQGRGSLAHALSACFKHAFDRDANEYCHLYPAQGQQSHSLRASLEASLENRLPAAPPERTARETLVTLGVTEETDPALSPVVQAFHLAAPGYASASAVQRAVASRLVAQAPVEARTAQRILDLGCGTGGVGRAWLQANDGAVCHLCGVDGAPNMLAQARLAAFDVRLQYCQGTLEQVPTTIDQHAPWDLLLSSFALHWASAPELAVQEWAKRLRPGGWLGIALPVRGSMVALAKAWAGVDDYQHIVTFPEWPVLLDRLITAVSPSRFEAWEQVFYSEHDSLLAIKRSLQTLGAAGLQNTKRPGVLTPRQLRKLENTMAEHASSRGKLPLAYVVGFLWLQKPEY
jgi:SAM-dependent methyltransferase/dienelactone hydrolase